RERLRIIKQHFFNREYTAIFTNPDLLPVYAAEYIPGRALCYRSLFIRIKELRDVLSGRGQFVFCLGAGNGSEVVGIAAAMVGLRLAGGANAGGGASEPEVEVHCQDLSSYDPVMSLLDSAIRSTWSIPQSTLTLSTSVSDLLDGDPANQAALAAHLARAHLVTAMFVLNELLATSKSGFVKLVTALVTHMPKGSLLLVVDSAGSFSDAKVGAGQYKVYTLLDAVQGLEAVVKEDSVWYRYPDGLNYPTKIQNMRHFVRLYRRT
ncbi:hypothetical protein BDK51DRAFT_19192, partial [Blyttiomyces helicus]